MVERGAADLREVPPAPPAPPVPPGTGPAPQGARFRLRPVPIIIVVLLGLGLPILAALIIDFVSDHIRLPSVHRSELSYLYVQHGVQFLLALIAIAIAKRIVPADYGLHRPPGKTYILPAVLWGLFFGVLMTLVDYGPQILSHMPPNFNDPVTPRTITGWLFFEGVYVGPTEEVLFRSLLVTYLAATMPGKLTFRGYDMNGAGVVVAVIFALAHLGSFITESPLLALGQQIYAFALGVLYAYWLEKSKSVLAPIVGHNVSDVTEYALMFAMILAWR